MNAQVKTLLSYDPIVKRELFEEPSEMSDIARLAMLKSYREELRNLVDSVDVDMLLDEDTDTASRRLEKIRTAVSLHICDHIW